MKCIKVYSRRYDVLVKKGCAKKVLTTGKISCGDCYCEFVDCDHCGLKNGDISLYAASIEETSDKTFDVTEMLKLYYKPIPDFEVNVGDRFKTDEGIIDVIKEETRNGIFYKLQRNGQNVSGAVMQIELLKMTLLNKFNNVEKIEY